MVGTGRAAELGVLFRKGEALQTLRDVTVVALDKTGTLTKGRPELPDLEPAAGFGSEEVLALVASVERQSEHPIAEAIVAAAAARGLHVSPPATFDATPRFALSAQVRGREVQVGSDRLLPLSGHTVPALLHDAMELGAMG